MIIVPETLIIMNNLTQYLLTLMFIPQVGRNLPGCPGHDLLPAPGALAQCGGRAHEGNILTIKLFSNICIYIACQVLGEECPGEDHRGGAGEERRPHCHIPGSHSQFV